LERHTLASGERASVDEQMIVERIHAAVMRQALRPKTKLSESALCKTFDVGRMKVRRALLLLASQGIVDLQSNRGAFIACPDLKQASEIFEARKLIEPNLIERLSMAIDAGGICVLSDHIDAEKQARQKRAPGNHSSVRGVSCCDRQRFRQHVFNAHGSRTCRAHVPDRRPFRR